MIVVPGSAEGSAFDELADAVVDADAGTDGAHLVGHVGEVARLDAGDGLDLGRRLDLEYADGVGAVERIVDGRVLEVDAREVDVVAGALFDEQKGILHLGERSQRQEVDLDESGVVYAVLIPVADVAPLDGAGLHRHPVYQRRRAQDHAARVLRQVLGKAGQLPRQVDEIAPHRRVHPAFELGERAHLRVQRSGMRRVDPLG